MTAAAEDGQPPKALAASDRRPGEKGGKHGLARPEATAIPDTQRFPSYYAPTLPTAGGSLLRYPSLQNRDGEEGRETHAKHT